jgi:hypothetical protein
MGRWKGAVDPTTQWDDGKVQWILLPNGTMERCRGSYYLKGQWKGAVDPLPVGQLMGTVDPATKRAGE